MSNIQIGNTKPRIKYEADGEQKSFDFFFPIFSASNIVVYFKDEIQTDNFDVSYLEEDQKGSVTFDTAPTLGTIITITRELPIQRTTNFSESKSFRAKTLNHEFDYQVACLEELADKLERSINIPIYSPIESKLSFPYPDAGKALIWDSNAEQLKNSEINVDSLISNIQNVKSSADTASHCASQAIEAANVASNSATDVLERLGTLMAAIEDKISKSDLITYETDWFDIAAYGLYIFTMPQDILSIPAEKRKVRLATKIKTATTDYHAGDIIDVSYTNSTGASGVEQGCSIVFRNSVCRIALGSAAAFFYTKGDGGSASVNKTNCQIKLFIEGITS